MGARRQEFIINGKKYELTPQEMEVIRNYASGGQGLSGNMSASFAKVYQKKEKWSDQTRWVEASKFFGRNEIREALRDYSLQLNSPLYVYSKLQQMAENTEKDADRIRAVELIGKTSAMFTDNINETVKTSVLFGDEDDEE